DGASRAGVTVGPARRSRGCARGIGATAAGAAGVGSAPVVATRGEQRAHRRSAPVVAARREQRASRRVAPVVAGAEQLADGIAAALADSIHAFRATSAADRRCVPGVT